MRDLSAQAPTRWAMLKNKSSAPFYLPQRRSEPATTVSMTGPFGSVMAKRKKGGFRRSA